MANPVVVATPQVVHAQPVARQHVQHAGMATRQYASPYDGSLHAHPALAMGETSLPEIPQGAPPGGRWIHRPAIGIVTCCIAFWLFPYVPTHNHRRSFPPLLYPSLVISQLHLSSLIPITLHLRVWYKCTPCFCAHTNSRCLLPERAF